MKQNRSILTPKYVHPKVIRVFLQYADVIVDILNDSSFEEYHMLLQNISVDIPFEPHIWDFLIANEKTLTIYLRRFLEVQELGGDTQKVILKNNQYVKYINGLRKKKIGMIKDEKMLEPHDIAYWDRQIIFKEIIEEHITKYYQTRKGSYRYLEVEDVCKFFSDNNESQSISGKELYKQFLNEKGKYDFNLTRESVGRYLKNTTRFYCQHRIHFKDRRKVVYSLIK
jgi:hypothetical protein